MGVAYPLTRGDHGVAQAVLLPACLRKLLRRELAWVRVRVRVLG
jgi:hypothetical protein